MNPQGWCFRTQGLLALSLLGVGVDASEPPPIDARLLCPARPDPGRVGCELSVAVRSAEYQRLAWVDALVVRAPPFARPLRARITQPLPRGGAPAATVSLAFLATDLGRGEVGIEVRTVLCPVGEGEGRCRPVSVTVAREIVVGS